MIKRQHWIRIHQRRQRNRRLALWRFHPRAPILDIGSRRKGSIERLDLIISQKRAPFFSPQTNISVAGWARCVEIAALTVIVGFLRAGWITGCSVFVADAATCAQSV